MVNYKSRRNGAERSVRIDEEELFQNQSSGIQFADMWPNSMKCRMKKKSSDDADDFVLVETGMC